MNTELVSKIVNNALPYQNITGKKPTVIIGISEYGPKFVPIKAESLEQVGSIFGFGSQLHRAYRECINGGGENIYLIKLNGRESSTILRDTLSQPALFVRSVGSGEPYNTIYMAVKDVESDEGTRRYLTIANYSNEIGSSHLLSGRPINEVIDEVNDLAFYGESEVYLTGYGDLSRDAGTLETTERTLSHGSNDFDMDDESFLASLKYIFENLKRTEVSNIALLESRFSNFVTGEGYIYDYLSHFCKTMDDQGNPCFISTGLDMYNYSSSWTAKLELFKQDCEPTETEPAYYSISEYINILIAKLKAEDENGEFISNGVAAYAGLIDALESGDSTSNRKIYGISGLDLVLHDQENKEYSSEGFVVVTGNSRLGYRFYQGVNLLKLTGGKSYSQVLDEETMEVNSYLEEKSRALERISNVKLVSDIKRDIYNEIDSNLGSIKYEEDIKQIVSSIMSKYLNIIRTYEVGIDTTYDSSVLNYSVDIDLEIFGEIDSVAVSIAV